jgi:hypothetical protein
MMKLVAMMMVASVLALSCATPVYVEKAESANLAKYKTYAWVEMRNSQDDSQSVSGLADNAVRNAVKEELNKLGWRETTGTPDVLLSYDILVERSTETQQESVYSRPFTRVYYNPWVRRWGTIYYPSRFIGYDTYDVPVREGTLTLTMTDAQTDKVVWQAWTTEQMENRKFASADIEKAAKNIVKKIESSE